MAASIQHLYPKDEAQRLAALRRYDILDTPPEATFDRITAIAARLFSVPIAVISLVDESRIWFKSHHGLNVQEIARDPGLCASAILQTQAWVLSNARDDARSAANPLVAGDFGLQFYVGVPLATQDGFNLGMLCVLDHEPHPVTERQLGDLKDLASIVMDLMELRLSARRAIAGATRLAGERETALELAGWMARESDDRVLSSLELVTGLLRHQSWSVGGSQCAAELTVAANRVATISRAHQHLSASGGARTVDGAAYLRQLCADLPGVIGPDRTVDFVADDVQLNMSPRQLVALGLIVNELVANAAAHGGTAIKVALEKQAERYTLSVSDNGPGLPDGFDLTASSGLGMKIVLAQLQHFKGRFTTSPADGGSGASMTVSFPPAALD
jgi:two-component sensor histidine kinase